MLSPGSCPIWHLSSSAEMNPLPPVIHQLLISHDGYVLTILSTSLSSPLTLICSFLHGADRAGVSCATFFHTSETGAMIFASHRCRVQRCTPHIFAMDASMPFIKHSSAVINHITHC